MTNNYLENFSLKSYNTFGIDVKCRYFIEVESIEKLKSVLEEKISPSIFILGGGSNILFTHDYSGLVIKINIKGKQVEKEEGNHVFVKVYAGESWHEFVLWTIENGWGGLENLSLIPGSCGAAPMQNIGAYGVEIKDVFVRLEALHRESLEVHTFDHEACHFGYRESVFKRDLKDQYIILSIVYRLSSRPRFNTSYGAIEEELEKMGVKEKSLKSVSDAVIAIRQSKLPNPIEIGNSGSFFKNPVIQKSAFDQLHQTYPSMPYYKVEEDYKIPAGWLIEQCGWKGKVVGNTGSHAKQALVLVNYGDATGAEVIALAKAIQASVKAKFDIEIEMEVNIV